MALAYVSHVLSLCLAHVFTYSNWRFLIFIKNRNKSLLSLVIYRTLLSIWVYMKIWCWIARQKLSSHFKLNVKNLPCCCCQFMHCCIWPLLMKKVTFNTRPDMFFLYHIVSERSGIAIYHYINKLGECCIPYLDITKRKLTKSGYKFFCVVIQGIFCEVFH